MHLKFTEEYIKSTVIPVLLRAMLGLESCIMNIFQSAVAAVCRNSFGKS
jgi:hypothetical protein